jgi:hypothetical protein
MLIQIPDEKVQELLYFLNEASKRKKITLRQLQSLCGSLALCARALPAGQIPQPSETLPALSEKSFNIELETHKSSKI